MDSLGPVNRGGKIDAARRPSRPKLGRLVVASLGVLSMALQICGCGRNSGDGVEEYVGRLRSVVRRFQHDAGRWDRQMRKPLRKAKGPEARAAVIAVVVRANRSLVSADLAVVRSLNPPKRAGYLHRCVERLIEAVARHDDEWLKAQRAGAKAAELDGLTAKHFAVEMQLIEEVQSAEEALGVAPVIQMVVPDDLPRKSHGAEAIALQTMFFDAGNERGQPGPTLAFAPLPE